MVLLSADVTSEKNCFFYSIHIYLSIYLSIPQSDRPLYQSWEIKKKIYRKKRVKSVSAQCLWEFFFLLFFFINKIYDFELKEKRLQHSFIFSFHIFVVVIVLYTRLALTASSTNHILHISRTLYLFVYIFVRLCVCACIGGNVLECVSHFFHEFSIQNTLLLIFFVSDLLHIWILNRVLHSTHTHSRYLDLICILNMWKCEKNFTRGGNSPEVFFSSHFSKKRKKKEKENVNCERW